MVGVENVMPWVLQAMLGEVLGGLDGRWSPGVDFELEDVAHELGIPVLGFETVEEQITLLASDPIEFQAVDLRSALVALRHGVDFEAVNAAGFAEMWDIWRDGRLDELAFVTQTNGEWMVDMTDAEIAAAYGVSESEYALMRSEIETFYPLEMQQGRQVVSERLLGDRNRDWMIEITGMLARPGTFFIGVGAAHLVGDAGLPALLQDAGIMVKRIE
jgi:uncharacterized protein YbaP (TraB family)